MKIAVDTTILIDVFGADKVHGQASFDVLMQSATSHSLVVCEIVAGELARIIPDIERAETDLQRFGIRFEPMNFEAAWFAGQLHIDYRRQGGQRTRILSDFLIGAHAMKQCDALLTRDRGFYRAYFAGLKIIEP